MPTQSLHILDPPHHITATRLQPVLIGMTGLAERPPDVAHLSGLVDDPEIAAILDFLCIHPFTDGNGRVSRLLTLLLLYHAGYEVGRYISLERIVEQGWESYYESLEASSRGWHTGDHDPFPWMRYFWGTLLRAYGELEERVATIGTGKGSKTRQVRAAVERKLAPFAISELLRDCPGVSKEMVRRVLRKMRDEGSLVVEGKGRGSRWKKSEGGALPAAGIASGAPSQE